MRPHERAGAEFSDKVDKVPGPKKPKEIHDARHRVCLEGIKSLPDLSYFGMDLPGDIGVSTDGRPGGF